MVSKTVDEAGAAATGAEAKTGAEVKNDAVAVDTAASDEAVETAGEPTEAAEADAEAETHADEDVDADVAPEGPSGVGQGAGAVVSAALGLVSLTGSWVSTVASARETLVGQLHTSSSASVATQIKEVYGDAWHTTALWGGFFALVALLVGVVVLARPAFGAPGRPQAAWIKSVAWGGVALGVIGLLLAVAKYTDILLGLPSTS